MASAATMYSCSRRDRICPRTSLAVPDQENRVRKARAEQRLRIQGINERIASLEKQLKDKDDQLADKDRIIKLLEQKIEVLEAMQHIDSSDPLKDYPFTPGVADKGDPKSMRV